MSKSIGEKAVIVSAADRAEVPFLLKQLDKGEPLTEREMAVLERTGSLQPKDARSEIAAVSDIIDPSIADYERKKELQLLSKKNLVSKFARKEQVRELSGLHIKLEVAKKKMFAWKERAEAQKALDEYYENNKGKIGHATTFDVMALIRGDRTFEDMFSPELEALAKRYKEELGL